MERSFASGLTLLALTCIAAPAGAQSVDAEPDYGTGDAGVVSKPISNVTANDSVNAVHVVLGAGGNATIAKVGRWQTGIGLNLANGAISTTAAVPAGQYSYQYLLCDTAVPSNCVSSPVTVSLIVPAIVAVPDSGSAVAGKGAKPIASVVANDSINGAPATLGTGSNATIAKVGTWPIGIGLNATTGAISTAATVPPATYSLPYKLCDRNTTPVCTSVTDTLTISDPSVDTAPTSTSVSAAKATSQNNPSCTAIQPYYFEIGTASAPLLSVSQGSGPAGRITAVTQMNWASASKWIYASYVLQIRGGLSNLTAEDIAALNMTDGYSNMGANSPVGECPDSNMPDSINACLAMFNPVNGLPYNYRDPATIGYFDYDAGHFENHASQYTSIADLGRTDLGPAIATVLGLSNSLDYEQPLLAGGIYGAPRQYTAVLQGILSGSLLMRDALGTNLTCTSTAAPCHAIYTPLDRTWDYSVGHWVEDNTAAGNDGAFSNVGAQGFYAWIDASKTFYGLVARASNKRGQQGLMSATCGAAIRAAWFSGIETEPGAVSR